MKKNIDTITKAELRDVVKKLDRLKEWQFIITFRKIWPFVSIERSNIITIETLREYREFQIMKELMKK